MVGLLLLDTRERAGKKTQSLPMRGLQGREGQRQPEVRGEKTKDGRATEAQRTDIGTGGQDVLSFQSRPRRSWI